jgi:hypothetical protein
VPKMASFRGFFRSFSFILDPLVRPPHILADAAKLATDRVSVDAD